MNLIGNFKGHIFNYKTSKLSGLNITSGFILVMLFFFQILTGILLTLTFKLPSNDFITSTLENLYLFKYGFLIKHLHALKSAFIILTLYLHLFKSIYYKVWMGNLKTLWSLVSGFILFFLTLELCFTGYLIPWGQMSFWGIKVITNVLGILPIIGIRLIQLILGNLEITNLLIQRLVTIHFLSGLLVIPIIFIHIFVVHLLKSTDYYNNFKKNSINFVDFYPISLYKDFLIFNFVVISLVVLLFFNKELLFNFLNNNEITKMSTPNMIIPEWFFLPFYGCLKLIENKIIGVFILVLFILIILVICFIR